MTKNDCVSRNLFFFNCHCIVIILLITLHYLFEPMPLDTISRVKIIIINYH